MQLFGNLLTNASKLPPDTLQQRYLAMTGAHKTPVIDAVTFVAAMSGVSRKTTRGWYSALESRGWESAFTEGFGHTQQIDAKAVVDAMIGNDVMREDLHQLDANLPSLDQEADDKLEQQIESKPSLVRQSTLQKWRQHPNFVVGMRGAELTTQWLVNGWQKALYADYMDWLNQHMPSMFGSLQHSTRFLNSFHASFSAACHTCVASSLHAILPAIGIPSLLSRAIDIVSINAHSLLPTIQIYTTCQ